MKCTDTCPHCHQNTVTEDRTNAPMRCAHCGRTFTPKPSDRFTAAADDGAPPPDQRQQNQAFRQAPTSHEDKLREGLTKGRSPIGPAPPDERTEAQRTQVPSPIRHSTPEEILETRVKAIHADIKRRK